MSTDASPWHPGEIEAQRRAGVDPAHIATVTAFLRPFLNEQHRAFYPRLPFVVVGVVDEEGRPWATILDGPRAFMRADDDRHLRIDARPLDDDPAALGMGVGRAIGLLGIELETRRRNRLNGRVVQADDHGMLVEVERAFGNCPKYIHTRDLHFEAAPSDIPAGEVMASLDDEARAQIRASGTFFVASFTEAARRQVDVSHRGGRPGFVEVDGDWLTIPDFAGNQFFNTLGNFLVNPRAGMLFPDFESGDVLQLTGSVEVSFDSPRLATFQGAQRLWRVRVERAVRRRGVLRWRGPVRDPSAEADLTGTWNEASESIARVAAIGWRRFRVEGVVDETPEVRSIFLRPLEGFVGGFERGGMHLVLRLPSEGAGRALVRSYSLSRLPADGAYRISVKTDGAGSREMRRRLVTGTEFEARGPQGEFTVDVESPRPVVLMSAGIGITPMLAMAEQLIASDLAAGRRRPVHFLHGARDGGAMPFVSELLALQDQAQGMFSITRCFSRPGRNDRPGVAYEFEGRLSVDTLRKVLPFDDHDFYLCGPAAFLQQVYDDLRALGIADDRMHAETFGPSALRRSSPTIACVPLPEVPVASEAPVPVRFARADRVATWAPGCGTLLEFAERCGLEPDFGCRDGSCGTCRTRVLAGRVAYPGRVGPGGPPGTALICCSVPAREDDGGTHLVLDL